MVLYPGPSTVSAPVPALKGRLQSPSARCATRHTDARWAFGTHVHNCMGATVRPPKRASFSLSCRGNENEPLPNPLASRRSESIQWHPSCAWGTDWGLGRGLVWSSQATWTRGVEDAPRARCCTPHGDGLDLLAVCLPLPLPRRRRCGAARGSESAASGRLGGALSGAWHPVAAPGFKRTCQEQSGDWETRCKTANVAPFLPSPYPLSLCSVTSHQETGPRPTRITFPGLLRQMALTWMASTRESILPHISGGAKSKVKVSAGQEVIPCLSPGFRWPPSVLGTPVSVPSLTWLFVSVSPPLLRGDQLLDLRLVLNPGRSYLEKLN